jgi:hypothetical protein
MVREASVVEKSALTLKPTRGLDPQRLHHRGEDRPARMANGHSAWPTVRQEPLVRAAQPRGPSPLTVLGQVLGHQETDQVTRASAAWPLRPGWKKSRVLTWLALNR